MYLILNYEMDSNRPDVSLLKKTINEFHKILTYT